jgi:hypothetical protein
MQLTYKNFTLHAKLLSKQMRAVNTIRLSIKLLILYTPQETHSYI